jgi:hypothetical protein
MRGFPFILVVLLSTIGISAAQNAASPRLDRMDATPPQTTQPHHPADALAPNIAVANFTVDSQWSTDRGWPSADVPIGKDY